LTALTNWRYRLANPAAGMAGCCVLEFIGEPFSIGLPRSRAGRELTAGAVDDNSTYLRLIARKSALRERIGEYGSPTAIAHYQRPLRRNTLFTQLRPDPRNMIA
jgi:hypothetical protein